MKFVFVLGESGAGKTTLCRATVSDEFLDEQITVHSIGQELRRLALRDPAIALSVKNGLPVSDQIITNLLSKKIQSDAVNIIDNYPQTRDSLRHLIEHIKEQFGADIFLKLVVCKRKPSFLGREESAAFISHREERYRQDMLPFINSLKAHGVSAIEVDDYSHDVATFLMNKHWRRITETPSPTE